MPARPRRGSRAATAQGRWLGPTNGRARSHRQCDLCRHRCPTASRPMCCRRLRKRGDWRFLFPLKFHHHRFWARTVPACASPAGGPHVPAAFQPLPCRAREAWGAPCAADATSGGVAVSVSACSISRQHCTGDQWPECRAGSAISCRCAVFAAGLRRAYRGAAWRDDARGVGRTQRDATACPHHCLACGRGPAVVRISRRRVLHAARSSARHLGVGRVLAWNDNVGGVLAQ